jgi:hypothetical protein
LDEKIKSHGQFFQTNCFQEITSLRRRGLSGSPNQVPQGRTSLGKNELFPRKRRPNRNLNQICWGEMNFP